MRGLVPDGGGIPHINDAVLASQDPIIGDKVTLAYVQAFQLGFRILAGIAVFKVVLCLGLKKVVLNDGKEQDIDITEEKGKKEKANVEVVQPVTV